jgi:hypothetical protein
MAGWLDRLRMILNTKEPLLFGLEDSTLLVIPLENMEDSQIEVPLTNTESIS